MYEATAAALDSAPKGHVHCRFTVEMQNLPTFDAHLNEIGAVQVERPDADIEEFLQWGDPELCVRFTAMVPSKHIPVVQERAENFIDLR